MANKDAILSLRIFIQSTGTTKTLRFGSDMSVGEVLKEIAEKGTTDPGKDHGLFSPANKESGKKGYWMAKNRALRFYGIQSNALLEYKKKHRPLKVRLADDTVKMVIIDDSATVRAIADQIGEKIGLKSAEEFSLRKVTPPGMSKAPAWLNEQQTLHEQDIADDEELEFAKKYFYSDDNIDKDDPFTLHLLYVEANKAIVEGRYPVSRTDAKDFAAIQMQIVYGDHDVNKHKPGFFDVDKFLPPQFRKDKKVVSDILQDHKKLAGMKEMNAKYRYVQLVRSLKTYGITFFDCREKQGSKKPVPVFIGVTRDKILKVDPETMRPIKEWTLEQLRRWSSAHNTFTLDFGDYEGDYVNVITDEGEALSQLIAGYIDIILKSRVDTDRVIADDDDDVAEEEMMTGQFGIANVGLTMSHSNPYGQGAGQGAMNDPGAQLSRQYPGPNPTSMTPVPPSQKVNVVDMGSAVKMTRLLGTELAAAKGKFGAPGKLTEEEWRKQFNQHRAKIDDMVKDLIASGKLGPGSLNRNQLDGKAKELAMEMNNMATAARNLAALSDENSPLVDGTRATAESVADLIELMLRAVDEPNPPGLLEALEAAAKQLVGTSLLTADPKLANYADKGAELLMLECIKDVDVNMNDLLNTSQMASEALPPGRKEQLKDEAEKVKAVKAFALHSLRNLAPSVLEPAVASQVQGANATLLNLTAELVGKAKQLGVPGDYGPRLTDAHDRVALALKNLIEATKVAERRGIEGNLDIIEPTNELLSSLADIRGNIGDANRVVEGVKNVTKAQNKIISVAKMLSEGADEETKNRLKNASSNLSQGVKDLMTEARLLTRDPSDLELQGKVVAVVGKLESQCQEIITDAGSITALNNLRYTSKTAAASLIKLTTAANIISAGVEDSAARAELLAASKRVQSSLAGLLSALQSAAKDPANFVSQSELLDAARAAVPMYSDLSTTSKKAARFVNDPNRKQDLNYAATDTADNLKLLMKAITEVADISNQSDLESALAEFDAVKADLETAEFYAHQGLLVPQPGLTRENALALLKLATDTMTKAADDLAGAAKTGAPLPDHVKQGAAGMSQVASAARSMATTISDRQTQKRIVGSAKELCDNTLNLIALSRALQIDRANPAKQAAVGKSRQAFIATLGSLMSAALGLDSKDINKAIEDIQAAKGQIRKDAPTRMNYKDASESLQGSGKALSAAVNQISAVAANNPMLLGSAAKMTGATTQQLLVMVSNAASAAPDAAIQDAILAAARQLADAMGGLLNSAKMTAVKKTPQTLNALKDNSDKAAKSIEELMNALGNATSAEAEQAIHRIMGTLTALDAGQLEVIPGSREDLLNEFLQAAKDMARVTGSLVTSARVSASKLGLFSKEAASTVKSLITTAKAASLADGSSSQMSLDGSRIVKGAEFIMENPDDTKRVMGCAKKITQAGAKLIANAKEHAKAEPDRQRRADVVRNAQSVVNSATQLAAASRDAAKRTPEAIKRLVDTARELRDHTIALEDSMRSGKTTEQLLEEVIDPAVAHQLMTTARTIAVETTGLIRASANVNANPDNGEMSDDMKRSTRQVTEAIQQLIKVTSTLNPGVQECERAIQSIQTASAELDAANISATIGNLSVPGAEAEPFPVHQANTSAVCKQLADALKGLVAAAGGSSKELVLAASSLAAVVPDLVANAKMTAGSTPERDTQASVLGSAKDVTDQLVATFRAVINANANDKESFNALQNASAQASEALGNLLGQLQSGQQLHAELDRIVRDISQAVQTMAQPAPASNKNYADCREELTASSKELAGAVTTLANVDKRNIGQVNLAATRTGEIVAALVQQSRLCIATTREQSAKNELVANTKALAGACVSMLAQTKALTAGQNVQPQLRQAYNNTNAAIASLLGSAKKGAVGEVMIDGAVNLINQSVGKLNSASIFAQAGQLEADRNSAQMTVQQMQQHLTGAANKVAQSSAGVGRATGGSDEDLGAAAQELAGTVKSVADIATATASRLPDSLAQQDVLSAAKFLSISSHQLILAAKDAQRLPNDNTAQQTLAASQSAISESVQRLVQAVQQSGAESARSERELEESKQAIIALLANVPGQRGASAEDVVSAAREVLAATSEMAFAANQSEAVAAGKNSYSAIDHLVNASKGASALSPDAAVAKGVTQAAGGVARSVVDLIEVGKLNRSDAATQPRVESASEKVAGAVNGLVQALRKLPNSEHITLQEAGIDLDAKAEQELLKCAKIIEDAAKILLAAKPPPREKKAPGVIDKMDINEAILDAATAIARATGSLVQSAAVAQRERTEQKMKPGTKYQNDPTWANGLISAAQQVSGSVQSLVEAANNAVQGAAEEEALVASARAVAAATAHLVAAAKAKADPNSQAQRTLASAAKAVANATAQLVSAAHKAGQFQDQEEEEEAAPVNFGSTAGKAKELEQQMRILKLEKELEKERTRMAGMRKQKYSEAKKQ